jgi:hypothetical protein
VTGTPAPRRRAFAPPGPPSYELLRQLPDSGDPDGALCLNQLAELAALGIPGCAGATSATWRDGMLISMAASHPSLAVLLDRQIQRGSGPVLDAARTRTTASCPDTLAASERRGDPPRWPEYASDALGCGVRWSQTLVHTFGALAITLTLYGARPKALNPDFLALASLLARVTGAALTSAAQSDSTRRTAGQLQEAITARSAVDQAKGMLMQALGCDADEALTQMRHLSQTRHVKVTAIAHRLTSRSMTPLTTFPGLRQPSRAAMGSS